MRRPWQGWRSCSRRRRRRRQDPATASAPRLIEVTAKQFAFEPARIEVTEGERVRLNVKSEDSVHGLQIKKFGSTP